MDGGKLSDIAQEEVECAFFCGAFGYSAGVLMSGQEGEGGTSRSRVFHPFCFEGDNYYIQEFQDVESHSEFELVNDIATKTAINC